MTDKEGPFAAHLQQDIFHWQQLGFMQTVSRDLIAAVPPGVQGISTSVQESFAHLLSDHFVAQLRAYVLTHQLARHEATRTKGIELPATPWHHWKAVHAESRWLRWFVKRWPVRKAVLTVDYREVWDELASYPWQNHVPMYPELGSPNRNVTLVSSDWTERWNSGGY